MKELFPLQTFHQDAVLKRLSELYENEKDLDSKVPTPVVADAGKVIAVDEDGKYVLGAASGGSKLYRHSIVLTYVPMQGIPPQIVLSFDYISNNSTPYTLDYLITNYDAIVKGKSNIFATNPTGATPTWVVRIVATTLDSNKIRFNAYQPGSSNPWDTGYISGATDTVTEL